jgi:hypothetical protein
MRSFACVFFFALLVAPTYGQVSGQPIVHQEILSPEQAQLYYRLGDALWADSLTETQVASVRNGLLSQSHKVIQEALKVVAAHQLEEFLEAPASNFGNVERAVRDIVQTALQRNTDAESINADMAESLSSNLEERDLVYDPVRETITSILIVAKSKALRNGGELIMPIPSSYLDTYGELLLDYSSMPRSEAIASIVQALSIAEIAGSQEYNLVHVLRTYGREPLNVVISLLSDVDALRALNPYARILFIRYLRMESMVHDFTDDQEGALMEILSNTDYFSSPPSLQIAVDILRQEMLDDSNSN